MNLKELSIRLGLSPTTVSRALNGYPEVNAQTRQRVEAAAKELNYHPNSRAIRLATGRAMAIGHVIPIASRHEIVNPVFADFIAGAGEAYTQNDYDLLLSVVPDDQEAETYRKLKLKGSVDGVMVHGPHRNDTRIPLLREIGLPFVVHGRATDCTEPYSWLDVNNRRAFLQATDYLIGLGHRRIGLVNGLEFLDFAIRRRSGYLDALSAKGIAPDPSLMFSGEMTEVSGFRAAQSLLAGPEPPTAILAASIISGMGVRRAIEAAGLQAGRDASIVIFDDDLSYLKNGEDRPIFTSMRSSVREAGRLAAEMLLKLIAQPESTAEGTLLEADLIIGQSTGPARPR